MSKEDLLNLECKYCNTVFNSKSNLTSHQKNAKYCLELQGKNKRTEFVCDICNKNFTSKRSLNEHYKKICSGVEKVIQNSFTEKEKEINILKNRLIKMEEDYKFLREENLCLKEKLSCETEKNVILSQFLEKSQKTIENLAEKAIEKPTISNNSNNNSNNNNNNNIKGSQYVQTFLADPNSYEELTEKERILSIAREKFEDYFWNGQKGVAKFCLDHIVKTKDGKMIICCTDPSRRRFKFINANKELKEDIEARIFTQKISVPIKLVCDEVFENVCNRIDNELEEKTSAFDLDFLEKKRDKAREKYFEIQDMDNNKENIDYKNELSALLNI